MSILNKIVEFVKNLFAHIPEEIREYAEKSLDITTNIRNFLASPVADIITAIIPGTWDDELKALALKYLGEAIPYLTIVKACENETTPEAMIACWVEQLGQYKPEVQTALLFKLATLLTAKFHDDQLAQSFYATAVQSLYAKTKIAE